jgi:signal transduction histidine kinase
MSDSVPAAIVETMTAFSIASGARRVGWQTVDLIAAVLLTSIAVAEVASSGHATPLAAAVAAMCAATVGWCRRAPTAAVCVGLASGAVLVAIGGVHIEIAPLVSVILYFMLGRRSAAGGWVLADALLVALPIPLVAADPGSSQVVDVVTVWLFFFAAPFAAGWWVGRGTLLASELQESVDKLAGQQRERALRAASEERARIARELHDVVAHNVSVMVVQTQAARRVTAGDLAAARSALESVSECGRDALVDMRRMIGVLHRGDVELAAPGLEQLPALVERTEASGIQVTLDVRGTTRTLPPPVDLALYRLAQEALTNVIKHADAAGAWVRVVHTPGAVELEISDDGRGSGGGSETHAAGHGLIGMRERIALYGGAVHVGDRPGGGFRVTARIPIDEDEAA